MPRTYKPSGTRQYKKYDDLVMQAALSEYEKSNRSLADMSKKYNIPKSVLHRHGTRITKKQGGQTILSEEVERCIVENLNHCAEWGYPLDTFDLRVLVKGYLDRAGITERRFKDNLPGPDFAKSFLRRNKDTISLRICQNIKRCRAAVSPEIIKSYFSELSTSLEGVPMCNVVNYDETNLSDDPGRRKIITKRGAKYPERVMNHSKASTSLMLAATGDGILLPCYVVYKAKNLYETWVQGGPRGCRYNCTASGWFDGNTFEDWVRTILIPYFNKKEGKKVLIGDNLSSHLSLSLINECKEHNIHFVFLPANSTHLTQPLDVAFFRPLKGVWRDILFNWKKTEGRANATIPKCVFPSLLKKLIDQTQCTAKANIEAGFQKAGIYPLDENKVLERLPEFIQTPQSFDKGAVDDAVLNILKELRYGTPGPSNNGKRKKIEITPGRSVCVEEEIKTSTQEETVITGSAANESDDGHEINEVKRTSTPAENVVLKHHTAKLVSEDRKRKFEEKAELKTKLARLSNTLLITKTNNKNVSEQNRNLKIKISETKEPKNKEVKLLKTKKIKSKNPKVSQHVLDENTKNNESEEIFKKPCTLKEYGRKIKMENEINNKIEEDKITMKAENSENAIIFNNISDGMLENIDNIDLENMPIFFSDDFNIEGEVEIHSNLEAEKINQNKETTPKEELNIIDITLKSPKKNKIQITSIENVDTKKVIVDFKHNKKISLSDPVNVLLKRKPKQFYSKEEDILRDLMDSNFK